MFVATRDAIGVNFNGICPKAAQSAGLKSGEMERPSAKPLRNPDQFDAHDPAQNRVQNIEHRLGLGLYGWSRDHRRLMLVQPNFH